VRTVTGDLNHAIANFLLALVGLTAVFFIIVVPTRLFVRWRERRAWRTRMDGVCGLPAERWLDMRPPPPGAYGGGM
jgi:hypothetical protein